MQTTNPKEWDKKLFSKVCSAFGPQRGKEVLKIVSKCVQLYVLNVNLTSSAQCSVERPDGRS
jgi:hypothetical protein